MHLVKGEISTIPYKDCDFIICKMSVDDLMYGNTPNLNLYTFLIRKGLVKLNEKEGKFLPTIDFLHLYPSKDEEKNERILEAFSNLDIMDINLIR